MRQDAPRSEQTKAPTSSLANSMHRQFVPSRMPLATSLSQHLAKQGVKQLAQINNHVEDIMGSIWLENPWQSNHIKNSIQWCQGGFSC